MTHCDYSTNVLVRQLVLGLVGALIVLAHRPVAVLLIYFCHKGSCADDEALGEAMWSLGGPTGDEGDNFLIAWSNVAGICDMLLNRDAFFGEEEVFLHGVEVLLTITIEGNLVAWFDGEEVFKDFAIAANMPSKDDVATFTRVVRATMLTDCVFGDLPDSDLLSLLYFHVPANFNYF